MPEAIILTVPARHLTTGDHTAGFVVSSITRWPDQSVEFKFVVPYQSAYITVLVQAQHLDAVSFPLTKRGDDYSPNARNAALGLPPIPPKPYVAPEPIASYPAGTKMGDVKHFDRSMHIAFRCPLHPEARYSSKDPYVSSWFSASDMERHDQCKATIDEYILTQEYLPTRNG